MDPNLFTKLEAELQEEFNQRPLDFLREADVVMNLMGKLRMEFSDSVEIEIDDQEEIERYNGISFSGKRNCSRVHSEMGCEDETGKMDIVVMKAEGGNRVYKKKKKMLGGFKAPFLIGMEVKVAFGKNTSRYTDNESRNGIHSDILKLNGLLTGGKIDHGCVVVIDFFTGREESIRARESARTHGIQFCYVSF